jgi:predicted nucleotidyltransferase
MPDMGIRRSPRPPTGIADALFSASQQRVLAHLFGQPERSFYASELIRLARGGSGAVQRELQKLELSGLVKTKRVGNQKHYQANPDAPLYNELTSIVRKTFGMAEPMRRALRPFSKDIVAAFVFGSVAKGRDRSASDIDLLVVSDRLTYADVFSALEPLRRELGREINPTVYSRVDFARKRRQGNTFLKRVLEQPKIWIVGNEAALAA